MSEAIKLNDADKAVDFTQVIQGHVSQSVKQVFHVERERTIHNRKLQLEAREIIVKDQFGNLYTCFVAKLIDGEVYAVTRWVAHPHSGLVAELRKLGARRFDDALLAWLQDEAFLAFGRATIALMKSRHAVAKHSNFVVPSGGDLDEVLTVNPSKS